MKATPITPSGSLIGVPTKATPDAFNIVYKYTGGRKSVDTTRSQYRREIIAEKAAKVAKAKAAVDTATKIRAATARLAQKERDIDELAARWAKQNENREAARREFEIELATRAHAAREFQVMAKIADTICKDFRLTPEDLRNTHNRKAGTVARQLFAYLVRKHTKIAHTPIARFIGATSHSASYANDAAVTNAVEENLPCPLSRTLPEKFWGMGWRELVEHFDGLVACRGPRWLPAFPSGEMMNDYAGHLQALAVLGGEE